MKKFVPFFAVLLCVTAAYAGPQKRSVVADTICNAPVDTMLKVAERFCYEFQATPDSLFKWAYLNLEEQPAEPVAKTGTKPKRNKEGRDVIKLRYKDRVYDPQNKTGDVAIDIYVLGVRWWKDQHLGSKYVLSHHPDKTYPLTAHMTATYTGSILEGGDIKMIMEPVSPTQTRVHYEFNLVFGKVLSAFISDKTWQNSLEWRFATIFDNLVECAETGTVSVRERGPRK